MVQQVVIQAQVGKLMIKYTMSRAKVCVKKNIVPLVKQRIQIFELQK